MADLLSGASIAYDIGHVCRGDQVVDGKGVFIYDLAVIPGGGQRAPDDIQGLLTTAQRQLMGEAVGIGIAIFSLSAFDFERLDIAGGRQLRHPFI